MTLTEMSKILVITDNLPDQVNGVVTTFKHLKRQAEKNGYQIEFIDPTGFPHCDALGYPEVKVSWPWGIGKKIKEINPDYIHIATEGPLGLAGRLWLDQQGWKYNTSYHTKFPEFLKEIYGIPLRWTYWYVRWFHKHSGRVLTTTKTMVNDLRSHGFNGDIKPWIRGVDRKELSPTVEHVKNSVPVVLYAGRVSKEKNLEKLLELSNKYHVIIVGDGPDRLRLEKIYLKAEFVGYKKGTELANYYARADVFAFPSCTDTFGIVMIEATSQGTPVAAYPVQGPLDIVEQGINGYLNQDLAIAIGLCLSLDRSAVKESSNKWTWEECWNIFHTNLISKN
jgi:glycosyltransferase involved in cell wall biosynthesis